MIPSHLPPVWPHEATGLSRVDARAHRLRWVAPCAVGLGLGLIWGCWRARRRPPAEGVELTPEQRRSLADALKLLAWLRARPTHRGAASVQALPRILEVVSALRSSICRGRASSGELSAPASPPPQSTRRAQVSHPLLDNAEAGSVRQLASLAAHFAPVGADTVSMIERELCVGEIAAVGDARDEAVSRLFQFCVARCLEAPEGVMRRFRHATVVPHDAPEFPPVAVHSVAVGLSKRQVLVYRPDRLLDWGGASSSDQSDAAPAFDAILATSPAARSPRMNRASPAAVKSRAVLRGMLHEALAGGIQRHWVSPPWVWKACRLVAPGPSVAERLMAQMAPVWPDAPTPDELAGELVSASARLLTDLVWGGPVSVGYHDALGLTQLLSCAVADLPDPGTALAAWFNRNPDAFAELGGALLEQADRLLRSMQAGTTQV